MFGEISIRPLTSHADFHACVALQRDTWGESFNDAVPASILLVSQRLGGVAAGAFSEDGRLQGFVFGMTGVEHGAIVHWSDMLAVRADAQNLGIGRRLKEFQRRAVAAVGARVIYWTFDPLVARNAHLNFNVFGVRAVEYVRDMYGANTGSELHRAIGTDRLIVAWPVDDAELEFHRARAAAARGNPEHVTSPIVCDAERPDHANDRSLGRVDRVRIAVPLDVSVLQGSDPQRASAWRQMTRAAFEGAFGAGYHVEGFVIDSLAERGYYLLRRGHE